MIEKAWTKDQRVTKPIKDPNALKELMSVYEKGSRNYLLLAFMLNTGLRVSDVIDLRLNDFEGAELRLIEKKTKKRKTITINNDLRALMADTAVAQRLEEHDYLFFNQRDRSAHISRIQAFRIVSHAGEMIGLNLSPHSLRKTFGYTHYQRTKDIVELMNIFNHAAPSVTLRYIGVDEETAYRNVYSHSIGL